MNRTVSAMLGTVLVLLGGIFMLVNLAFNAAGGWIWSAWPLVIVAAGALFMLAPIFFHREQWAGVFFIPGTPIITIGLVLLAASLTGAWSIWGWAWTLIILALAAGLALAGLTTRIYYMIVPAIILGATGLILAYCAISGDWAAWAWLWGLEVLAIGLMILLVGYLAHNLVVRTVGWSFVGFGAFAAAAMMAIVGQNSHVMAAVSAGIMIVGGIALIAGGLLTGRKSPAQPESPAANP